MLVQQWIKLDREKILVVFEKFGDDKELIGVAWGGVEMMMLPPEWLHPDFMDRVLEQLNEEW